MGHEHIIIVVIVPRFDQYIYIYVIGQEECLVGKEECLVGQEEHLVGQEECLLGQEECLLGQEEGLVGQEQRTILMVSDHQIMILYDPKNIFRPSGTRFYQ